MKTARLPVLSNALSVFVGEFHGAATTLPGSRLEGQRFALLLPRMQDPVE